MRLIYLLLVFMACLSAMPAAAQRDRHRSGDDLPGPGFSKANVINLGPRVGATLTSMGQPREVDLYDGVGMGFSLGLSMKTRLGYANENTQEGGTGLLGFALELLYKQNRVTTIGDKALSLGFFEVPLLLQVYPMKGSNAMNSLCFEAGLDFALLASKSPDVLRVNSHGIAYRTGDFKGGDIRLVVGAGYTVPRSSLNVNARYYIGTSDLAGNFPCKMNTLELSLAWMFSIAKF